MLSPLSSVQPACYYSSHSLVLMSTRCFHRALDPPRTGLGRFPLLVVAAIVMAVALWLLTGFVLSPLDAKPGA